MEVLLHINCERIDHERLCFRALEPPQHHYRNIEEHREHFQNRGIRCFPQHEPPLAALSHFRFHGLTRRSPERYSLS